MTGHNSAPGHGFFKGQTCNKAVLQYTQKSCKDFYPMLQLYCMFLYNNYKQLLL